VWEPRFDFCSFGPPDSLVVSPNPSGNSSRHNADVDSTREYVYRSDRMTFYALDDSTCLSGVDLEVSEETLRYRGLELHAGTRLTEVREAFPHSYSQRRTFEGTKEGTTELLMSSGEGGNSIFLNFRKGSLIGFDYVRSP